MPARLNCLPLCYYTSTQWAGISFDTFRSICQHYVSRQPKDSNRSEVIVAILYWNKGKIFGSLNLVFRERERSEEFLSDCGEVQMEGLIQLYKFRENTGSLSQTHNRWIVSKSSDAASRHPWDIRYYNISHISMCILRWNYFISLIYGSHWSCRDMTVHFMGQEGNWPFIWIQGRVPKVRRNFYCQMRCLFIQRSCRLNHQLIRRHKWVWPTTWQAFSFSTNSPNSTKVAISNHTSLFKLTLTF